MKLTMNDRQTVLLIHGTALFYECRKDDFTTIFNVSNFLVTTSLPRLLTT